MALCKSPSYFGHSKNHLALRAISRLGKLLCLFENTPGAGGQTIPTEPVSLISKAVAVRVPACSLALRVPPAHLLCSYKSISPEKNCRKKYFTWLFLSHLLIISLHICTWVTCHLGIVWPARLVSAVLFFLLLEMVIFAYFSSITFLK